MIARVADHCFWLGRYIERAESVARQLHVTGQLALDAELPMRRVWHPLVIVAGQEHDYLARFGHAALGDAENIQRYLAFDAENPVSLVCAVAAARENARSIREVVSLEVWQIVNELHVFMGTEEARAMYEEDRDALYVYVQRSTQLALGLMRSTMLHDAPLDFMWLGVMLERLGQTARLLDVHHHALVKAIETESASHPVLETALWLSLLKASSGFEAYMKRNRRGVTRGTVAAFLVLEPRFPRSVRYCAEAATQRLAQICGGGDLRSKSAALARLEALDSWLASLDPAAVDGAQVHEVLTHVVDEAHTVCDAIGSELFLRRDDKDADARPSSLPPPLQKQSQ